MQTPEEILDEQLVKANVVIDTLGGQCPVQASGTIAGNQFYFNARGRKYELQIGNFGHIFIKEPWGKTAFAAGYMPEIDVKRLILKHAIDYMHPSSI